MVTLNQVMLMGHCLGLWESGSPLGGVGGRCEGTERLVEVVEERVVTGEAVMGIGTVLYRGQDGESKDSTLSSIGFHKPTSYLHQRH